MNKITRAQVHATVHPCDGAAVVYNHGGVVAAGIQFWTGKASHFLCLKGGTRVTEEDIGGCMATDLDTYMKGTCSLTILRVMPPLSIHEERLVLDFWESEVATPYGIGSVVRAFLATPVRRYVLPRFPGFGRFALRVLSRVMGHQAPDCSALWVMGIRKARPAFLRGYDAEEVTPEVILRDAAKLMHVIHWDRPVLSVGGR